MEQSSLDRLLIQMQFPGMPKLESSYTRAWLRKFGLGYDSFDFNVRLGNGREPIEGLMPEIAAATTALTQRRADIIGHRGGTVDIIEVKDSARFNAMGQLKGYKQLWLEATPDISVRQLIVVARDIAPDVQRVFAAEGIIYHLVEPEDYIA